MGQQLAEKIKRLHHPYHIIGKSITTGVLP
jgi:hypothetical protein